MRGEFIRGDGLIIPNNVTTSGRKEYLRMALRGIDTTQIGAGGNFFIGLCQVVPADILTLADITEPTIGVNGYARVPITRDSIGWPTEGAVGNEQFIETIDAVFAASSGDFDQAITRMFITPEITLTVGELWALSEAAFETPTVITPTTPVGQRTFNYRLFTR